MHYIDIDWFPPAAAIALAALVIVALRALAWLGHSRARARTHRGIERVLNEHDREDPSSKPI